MMYDDKAKVSFHDAARFTLSITGNITLATQWPNAKLDVEPMTDYDIIYCAFWPLTPADMEALKAAAEQRKWDVLPESEKAKSLAIAKTFRAAHR